MFHPFKCPHCHGTLKNHTWFCPYCETTVKKEYNKKQQPHCFIATAAYGTMWHKDIDILREYRDSVLVHSIFGRLFIKIYYTISPPIARLIKRSKTLKRVTRRIIKIILKRMK